MKERSTGMTPKAKRILAIIVSAVIAIALGITCALCLSTDKRKSVVDVEDGEGVTTSAAFSNLNGDALLNGVSNYTIKTGDYVDYTYNGGFYYVTIPRGTFTLECWGAQGAGGGKGGYSRMTIVMNDPQVCNIVVGGAGSGRTGGYNGGGNGTAGNGGGGGASHICHVNQNKLLKNCNMGNMVLVAGGGGGGGNISYAQSYASNGLVGQGTNSTYGGGSGYYSGSANGSYGRSGGNWLNTGAWGYTTSNRTNSYGVRGGNGLVRITVGAGINAGPVPTETGGKNIGSKARGGSINVTATTIAKNPDGTASAVWFTNGSGNLDLANSVELYLNSACTVSATNYVDWTKNTNRSTLSITKIKRYPRNGVDYQTADGVLTLYVKMVDNQGPANTKRGMNAIPFKITVTNSDIAVRTTSNPNSGGVVGNGYITYNKTSSTGAYSYRLGSSNFTGANDIYKDYTTTAGIYNPLGTGKQTVFIANTLQKQNTAGFTVNVADIYTDADTSYDKVAIKSFTVASGASCYPTNFTVTPTLDSETNGLYSALTIKPTNVLPNGTIAIAITLKVKQVEKVTKAEIGTENSAVTLVFKFANTRPFFASASDAANNAHRKAEPLVELNVGGPSKDLSLSDFLFDPDNSVSTFVTSNGLKIPDKDYISVTYNNTVVALTNSNYNKGSTVTNTWETGEGNADVWDNVEFPKEKRDRMIALAGTAQAANAWVTYSYVNSTTIRFTARAASQYMYKQTSPARLGDFYVLVRIADAGNTTDNGIWYPIAIKVNSSAPVEPNVTANVTLGFNEQSAGVGDTDGNGKDGAAGTPTSAYLTPVSYTDANGVLHGIGTTTPQQIGEANKQVTPFVTDKDIFAYPAGSGVSDFARELNEIVVLNGTTANAVIDTVYTDEFFTVTLVPLYAHKRVFELLTADQMANMHISELVGEERNGVSNADDIRKFYGLKVTAKSGTDNYYYEFDVKVVDSHGSKNDAVRVYVKVENRDVYLRRNDASSSYRFNTAEFGKYVPFDAARGTDYINYTITAGRTVYVTPYDLAYDFDTVSGLNPVDVSTGNATYNTNPANGSAFLTAADNITTKYNVKRTSVPSVAATAVTGGVSRGLLTFANPSSFNTTMSSYHTYFDAEMLETYDDNGVRKAIPVIKITANSRTAANLPLIRFSVTDGFSSVDCVISITVENAAPELKDTVADVYKITAGAADTQNGVMSSYEFTASSLAFDRDNDTVAFVADGVRVVAYDANNLSADGTHYFEAVKIVNGVYVGAELTDADAIPVSSFFTASITKGTGDYLGQNVILVTPYSSTQLSNLPMYVEFEVTDGFRAQEKISTLHVQIEVINSIPVFDAEETLKKEADDRIWYYSYDTVAQKGSARYIVGNEELYNSTAISASPANKLLLFSDADGNQTVLLDTHNDTLTTDLVKTVNELSDSRRITESDFGETNPDTAVLYTRTYGDSTSSQDYMELGSKAHFTVNVKFWRKNADGTFTPVTETTNTNLDDRKYWAIEIIDESVFEGNDYNGFRTQLAIAVKDEQDGKDVYVGDRDNSDKGASGVKVVNFFFHYQTPGVRAMHEFYRTDPNAEARVKLSTHLKPTGNTSGSVDESIENYSVDYEFIKKDFGSSLPYSGTVTGQTGLQSAKFNEEFRYYYFVNVRGGDRTPKRYNSSTPFKYEPVLVSANSASETIVPMSYLAMPQTFSVAAGTDASNQKHIVFNNVDDSGMYSDGETGGTPNYALWVDNETYLKKIFENVSLTDGKTEYKGYEGIKNNPYLSITYTADVTGLSSMYINTSRAEWDENADTPETPSVSAAYREDKYGFKIAKKQGSPRVTSTLRLSVDVKTNDNKQSAKTVFVDINVENSRPGNFGYDNNRNYVSFNVDLTTADSVGENAGAYAEFLKDGQTSQIPGKVSGARKTTIKYTDADGTDAMRFYLPSASDKKLSEVMTASELAHINTADSCTAASYNKYVSNLILDRNTNNEIAPGDTTYDTTVEDLVPNPGYTKFFTVSPTDDSSQTLQIVPVAKTQLNIPTSDADFNDYLTANHLAYDSRNGDIYYPFKVLAYDDCDGSGFTRGYWVLTVINVHIGNHRMAAVGGNNKVNTVKLTRGVNYAIDVSTLLTDYDVPVSGLSMTTDKAQWDDLDTPIPHDNASDKFDVAKNGQLVHDLLVMPVSGTTLNYKVYSDAACTDEITGSSLPISVKTASSLVASGGTPAVSDYSTIVFVTESAFKTVYYVTLTVNDGAGSSVTLKFKVQYANEAPFKNADTYGNANTIEIVMKKGDTFSLYATDVNTFDNDTKGGFVSPSKFDDIVAKGDYPSDTAEELLNNFLKYTTSDYNDKEVADADHYLGGLVVGDDDAPSTLRFLMRSTVFEGNLVGDNFTMAFLCPVSSEDGDGEYPTRIDIKAQGVVNNAVLKVALQDDKGNTTYVPVNITVLPTAPHVVSPIPSRLEKDYGMKAVAGEDNTYELTLKYGESFDERLDSFMDDIDLNDKQYIYIPSVFDGSKFKIIEPTGLTTVAASSTDEEFANRIKITALDFIPDSSDFTEVIFRVSDAHGAQSEEITFRIRIVPNELKPVTAGSTSMATLNVKSYAQYVDDGLEQVFEIVSKTTDGATAADRAAMMFIDPDVNAPSAQYDVSVYALLDKDLNPISANKLNSTDYQYKDESLICSVINGAPNAGSGSEVCMHVAKFFGVSITEDGKYLIVTPNAAIIQSDGTLSSINLYFEVSKRYTDGSSQTMATRSYTSKVTVADSDPIVVESNALNYGYPYLDNSMREEGFLSFTGTVGEELSWKLYDDNDENHGLFYDYDHMNYKDGNERLSFVRAEVGTLTNVREGENYMDGGKPKPNDPVLSVTESTDHSNLTIRINRKVKDQYRRQDEKTGELLPMLIPIDIYCADYVALKSKDTSKYVKTTILVTIENDPPVFKEVASSVGLGYSITGSEYTGFEMDLSIATGQVATIRLQDIINDADFDFDKFTLVNTNTSNPCIMPARSDAPAKLGNEMFSYYTVSNANEYGSQSLKTITITCLSKVRGDTLDCDLMISDGEARTSRLVIHLSVGNSAPVQKSIEQRSITIMGVDLGATVANPVFTDNIINYVTDINPSDCIDVTTGYDPDGERASKTYVYIDRFNVYTDSTAPTDSDRPSLYGPGLTESSDPDAEVVDSAFSIEWNENITHQTFGIKPTPGVFGVQKVSLRVYDGGYVDGANTVLDAEFTDVELIITVACPVDVSELDEFEIADRVTRKITPELLLNTDDEPYRAEGYEITGITVTGNLRAQAPANVQSAGYSVLPSAVTENDWRVTATARGGSDDKMSVTFKVGNTSVTHDFKVKVTTNSAPVISLTGNKAIYSKSELREGNIITVHPEDWFTDKDIDDVIRFVSPVKVKISAYADVHLNEQTNTIDIRFKGRGTTELTVNVCDLTNVATSYTITIGCSDMEELGWWAAFMAKIQTNPLLYGIIAGGILLLIIAIIIIAVIVHKRRKMRREIEALLNSEAELNEEMLRLSGGIGATMYQSYGYLPPASQAMNDPGLMLGSSANNPTPNNLQLGVGTGQTAGVQQTTDITGYPQTNPRTQNIPTDSMPGSNPQFGQGNPQFGNAARPQQPGANGMSQGAGQGGMQNNNFGNLPNDDGFDPDSF